MDRHAAVRSELDVGAAIGRQEARAVGKHRPPAAEECRKGSKSRTQRALEGTLSANRRRPAQADKLSNSPCARCRLLVSTNRRPHIRNRRFIRFRHHVFQSKPSVAPKASVAADDRRRIQPRASSRGNHRRRASSSCEPATQSRTGAASAPRHLARGSRIPRGRAPRSRVPPPRHETTNTSASPKCRPRAPRHHNSSLFSGGSRPIAWHRSDPT